MNQRIRATIITSLQLSASMSRGLLEKSVSESLSVTRGQVVREAELMKDDGIVEATGTYGDYWRLTSKGDRLTSPLWERIKEYMTDYLSTHWLAVIAAIISVIALFRK